ncbi:hypothetical protein Salat_0175600 [Sesamum alatum]|uniref:Uncharacterized protein n=1 Tax=Sesamum alatum TaxID=300844 RepID=A0AAE1YYR6_9LAMI|nr:hypothetical protein Salat_0175600 [Sesamum alatum]
MSSESSESANSSSNSSDSSSSSEVSSPMARDDVPKVEPRVAPEVVVEPKPPQEDVPPTHDAPLDARLFVKSCIKYKDLHRIYRDYHITTYCTLYIPNRDQAMHQPPPDCLTIHLPLLDAGLRFPIDPCVASLINHLRISPSQLVPNALSVL